MSRYNIYMSPTGGTKKVADCIVKQFALGDSDFKNIDLLQKREQIKDFSKDDICIISVPSYAGRVPAFAAERVKKMNGNGALAILVSVFGNRAIDDTLTELYDIVELCGFRTVSAVEAVAEHSLARIYGKGRPDIEDRKELVNFAEQIKNKILHGDYSTPEIPGNRPYKKVKLSPMDLLLDATCINCGKCADECPVDAISYDDVSKVDATKCFSCMHCVTVCPKNARHNSKEKEKFFEEHLKECCKERKKNRLYI